jgi:hypothetical protein
MKRIHALLAVQSLMAVLVSINRLWTWTLGYVLPNEFLRWVDFNNMLILPLISVLAFYLLKKTIEYHLPQYGAAAAHVCLLHRRLLAGADHKYHRVGFR